MVRRNIWWVETKSNATLRAVGTLRAVSAIAHSPVCKLHKVLQYNGAMQPELNSHPNAGFKINYVLLRTF